MTIRVWHLPVFSKLIFKVSHSVGSHSQNVAQTVLCCLNYSSFFSETYLEATSSLLSVMKRLDCCVPVQSIRVKKRMCWCIDHYEGNRVLCRKIDFAIFIVRVCLVCLTGFGCCHMLTASWSYRWELVSGVDQKWTSDSWRGTQQEVLPHPWHPLHPKVTFQLAWKDAAVWVNISVSV